MKNLKKAILAGSPTVNKGILSAVAAILEEGGFQLLNDGLREKWNPEPGAMDHCIRFGKDIALSLK